VSQREQTNHVRQFVYLAARFEHKNFIPELSLFDKITIKNISSYTKIKFIFNTLKKKIKFIILNFKKINENDSHRF